jgi:uncharacterized repeat protein (TIGR01451 family)
MGSLSFFIDDIAGANAQAKITLQDVTSNQVKVTVEVMTGVATGDITGVFFDVANNHVSGLSVLIDCVVVTATKFKVNDVLKVGYSSIAGDCLTPFDAGVAIGTTGASDFYSTATFTLSGTSLSNLIGQRFGVRLQSVGGAYSGQKSTLIGTVPDLAPVTLGNLVFLDLNANGVQDAGETGIGGVTVNLLDSSGVQVATTTTDASGSYSFTTNPGSYKVKVVAPSGFSYTLQDRGGDDTRDSDVDASGQSGPITLTSGQTDNTIDAGLLNVDIKVEKAFLNLEEFLLDVDSVDSDGDNHLEFETVQVVKPEQNAPISFQIQVTNNGQTKANQVNVTDLVDRRLLINSITVDHPSALIANHSSGQNINLILALNPGETRTITVTSQVNFSATDDLLPLDLQYSLDSDNPLLDEYHNVTIAGNIYTSALASTKAAGTTLISFNPFAPVQNTATATVLDAGVVDANPSNNTGTDTFRFLRLWLEGTLNDGVTPVKVLSLGAINFDVDPLFGWPGYVYQNSKLLGPGDVGQIQGQSFWANSSFSDISAFESASGTAAFDLFEEIVSQGTYGIGQSEQQNPKVTSDKSAVTINRVLDRNTPQTIAGNQTLNVGSSEILSDDVPILSLTASNNLQAQLEAQPSQPLLTGYSITIPVAGCYHNVFTTKLADLSSFYDRNNFIKAFAVESGIAKLVFSNPTTAADLDARSFNFVSSNPNLQIVWEGGNQKDKIIGSSRNDLIRGGNGTDDLAGGQGNDTIEGGNGVDLLKGEAGNDHLLGGNGNDLLVGGSGDDTLKGESGADTFIFGINSGNDTVLDLDGNDKIDLSQLVELDAISDLNTNTSGVSAYRIDAQDAFVTVTNGNLLLNLTSFGGGTITFMGVTSIPNSTFIF